MIAIVISFLFCREISCSRLSQRMSFIQAPPSGTKINQFALEFADLRYYRAVKMDGRLYFNSAGYVGSKASVAILDISESRELATRRNYSPG
jgi:hypothetical protein